MKRPEKLFDLPWQEFRDNFSDILELTRCFPIGYPDHDDCRRWEEHRHIQRQFYRLKQQFDEGDHLSGIEAYLLITKNLYHVPFWLEKWIGNALDRFSKAKGKERDLCKLLGMDTRQKTGNPYDIQLKSERNYRLSFAIEEVRLLTGCGVEKCCEILSCYYPPLDDADLGDFLSDFPRSKRTLVNIYRSWKATPYGREILSRINHDWCFSWGLDCFDKYDQAMIEAARRSDYAFSEQDRLSIFKKNPVFQLPPLPDGTTP